MLRITRISRFLMTVALFVAATAAYAFCAQEIKVNLVMSDDSIMIYAGANDGIKVGDKFMAIRADKEIGILEITRVEPTYSIAKVVSKTDEIREMDILVRPVTGAGLSGAPASKDDKDAKKKDDTKAGDKDAKKTADKKEKTKDSAKKESTKKESTKKESAKKKESTKKEKSSDTKDEDKKDSKEESKDEKSDKDKDEKQETKAPEASKTPEASATPNMYPSYTGATGLFQMPTAFIADAGKGAVSLFAYKDSRNASGATYGGTDLEAYSYASGYSEDTKIMALAYAFNENLEVSAAQINVDISSSVSLSNYFLTAEGMNEMSIKTTVLGVKFNPRKKYLLNDDTHKNFQYAVGLQSWSASGGGEDMTLYYLAVAMPTKKVALHGNVYYASASNLGSKKWGSSLGLEMPFVKNATFMGDVDQFQGEATYAVGLRYFFNEKAALTFGLHDLSDNPATLLSGSFGF